MRRIKYNFIKKKEKYINVLADILHKYNIPDGLIYNCDETNALFVPRANRTIAKCGTKRIRLIGVGKDKAQITCTLACTAEGDVLPVQYIFAGKSERCHPKIPPSEGSYFDHSESHWQTVKSYLEYLKRIIVAHKIKYITEKKLSLVQQKAILIHDLHFTHKEESVRDFLIENGIIPVYIPASCTDAMQVCDTVINKTFKCGMKAAFRDYLHKRYLEHVEDPQMENVLWQAKLTMGVLKPHIVSFVEVGLNALKTNKLKAAIIHAFKSHALLDESKSKNEIRRETIVNIDEDVMSIPDEEEINSDEDGSVVLGSNDDDDEEIFEPKKINPRSAPLIEPPGTKDQITSCCCGCGKNVAFSNHYCTTKKRITAWCHQVPQEGFGSVGICTGCHQLRLANENNEAEPIASTIEMSTKK